MRKALLLFCLLATFSTASAQLRDFRLDRVLGTPVDFPQDIQVSATGVVYMLDRVGLVKFDGAGHYRQTIPLRSATRTPDYRSLAVDRQGNVLVLNRAASFLRRYSAAGDSLTQIGQAGTAPGQFQQPEGVTVDAAGNIYVADTGNNRLQKLSAAGQVVWVYAPSGTQALVQPTDVKLAPDGSVYVLNNNYTAVKLSATGQLVNTMSLRFPGSVAYDQTIGLEIDAANMLYVVSSRMSSVQRYNAQGVYQGAFGGGGTFYGTHAALGLDSSGNVYVVDASDRDQSISTMRKLAPSGALLGKWGNEAVFGSRMRQDEAGNIYYIDQSQPRIVKMNPAGQQIALIGAAGQADGQFGVLTSFAIDLYGNVYGLEGQSFPPRVQKFDPQGRFVSKIALPNPQTNSNGYWPTDLAVDAGGNLFVLDYYSAVRKYNSQGQFQQMIGAGGSGSGPGPGQFYAPRGVVLDYRGNIYVSDGAGNRVQKFNPGGQLLREFLSVFRQTFQGSPSLSPGDAGLAVDGAGNVYASVGKNDFITMFEGSSTRQVKLVVGANPPLITINQRGTRLTCARVANDMLRLYVPTTSPPENLISGKVFNDLNNDCVQQGNEPALPNMVVVAEPGNGYGLTDETGSYTMAVDTGAYTVQQLLPPPQPGRVIQQLCASPSAVSFNSYGNAVTGPNFGNQVSTAPYLTVSVASNRRRRCFRNTTAVSYANIGFAAAANATVTVALPPEVVFVKANVPHTRNAAGQYVFQVGILQPEQRGTITIQDSVVCGNAALRGLTVCTRAWIRPVNTYPTPTGWNGASLAVTGKGVVGSNQVRFVVSNQGSGATTDSLGLRIFQDAELAMTRNVSLAAGDSLVLRWTATGPVVRVEADQPTNHPYGPVASATVEVAALRTTSLPSAAMRAMPPGDPQPEIAEDCQPILDSYDPNDKQVVPEGRTAQHYTPTGEALRYQIRFQNTGNDVAYRVAVVDTLAANLDISTLQVGAVSHPYRMTLSGHQRPVLTFTFDNIMLPDSAHNPAGSQGFVQFSIKPKAALPARTRIDNLADIFFDYNLPIRTNTTTNRIYDMPRTVVPVVALQYPEVLASPIITAMAPAQGRFGTLVTLTGRKFSPAAANNRVAFNGVAAPVQSATSTTLTVRVPSGATTGTLTLTTADGGTRSSSFTVFQPPTLTTITPGEGQPGSMVALTGTYFSAVTVQDTVTFNGMPARVLQATPSGLQVEVPTGATLGTIRVRTLGGQVESAQPFMVWYPPTISSTLPGRQRTSATVALTGTHFADVGSRNVVTFGGGQAGRVLQASPTRLVVQVPTAAQTGPIQVQTPGGQATTATSLVVIPPPIITSFSPVQGPVGTSVTITGRNFGEEGLNDTILVAGIAARVLRATATSVEVVVPRGAVTGALTAAGAGGSGQSGTAFNVSTLSLNEAVTIYPNPTRDQVTISWRNAEFVVQQVRIYDTIGTLIATAAVSSATSDELTVPLTHCRAGIYITVIETPAGRIVKRITLL